MNLTLRFSASDQPLRHRAGGVLLALGAMVMGGCATTTLPEVNPSAPTVQVQTPQPLPPATRPASPPMIVQGPLSDIGTAPAARAPVAALAAPTATPNGMIARVSANVAKNDTRNA